MGRAPCCDKTKVKRGPWSPEEDTILKNYLEKHGTGGNWIALPHKAGLNRCGKSCRLRWLNYLRPDLKHGDFTDEEDNKILTLYTNIGSRWSVIASHLPGRTDNDVKNYWNTKLKKRLLLATSGAKRDHQVSNAINPTTLIHTNSSISHDFSSNPSDFSFCYGNSSYNNPIMVSSDTLVQYSSVDMIQQGYYPAVPDMFPLPRLLEVEENNGFTTSSSQEISSLSPSYSLAKSYASWNDNGVGEEVGLFRELESKSYNYGVHQITQQQEEVTEVDPWFQFN
ncbi:hypothetical protein ACH5RR_004124 [Cinchona calisaya]|uniref:Uncharacterized protein n=1 Tax=Cinchona calisaya TaxID=153742 RepID=A0ABD3AX17_9GENT